MKYLITILLLFAFSCSPDFQKPHYKKHFQTGHGWKQKQIPIWKQGTFRNPSVKKETKRKMIQPPQINFDKW
jgi:hypothetical protein